MVVLQGTNQPSCARLTNTIVTQVQHANLYFLYCKKDRNNYLNDLCQYWEILDDHPFNNGLVHVELAMVGCAVEVADKRERLQVRVRHHRLHQCWKARADVHCDFGIAYVQER